MQTISLEQMAAFMRLSAQEFEQNLDRLSALDAALGDGDHGVTMVKGYRALLAMMDAQEFTDIGSMWMEAGKTLVKEMGGTCGPLFGTIYLKGGMLSKGKTEVTLEELANMLTQGNNGVKAMGKANVGDKTMIDALEPGALALAAAAGSGKDLATALEEAYQASVQGAEATCDMLATRGRGRYQGEGSKGHQDAGATSVTVLFHTLWCAVQ